MNAPVTNLISRLSAALEGREIGENRADRRAFLCQVISGITIGQLAFPRAAHPEVRERGQRAAGALRQVQMPATLQASAFASASGDDARYHALVHEGGGAAGKALLTTPVSDQEVAGRLRELGAEDGGGVPISAWNLRNLPLVGAPRRRVAGTPLRILVKSEGWDSPRDLSSLFQDPAGLGIAFRFGGNEEHDQRWESGCIACLFSCPGGVVSNERYTIRDHVREVTRFSPDVNLPEGETPVTVTIELLG